MKAFKSLGFVLITMIGLICLSPQLLAIVDTSSFNERETHIKLNDASANSNTYLAAEETMQLEANVTKFDVVTCEIKTIEIEVSSVGLRPSFKVAVFIKPRLSANIHSTNVLHYLQKTNQLTGDYRPIFKVGWHFTA